MRTCILIVSACFCLTACMPTSQSLAAEAIISQQSEDSLAEIHHLVRTALHDDTLQLSPQVLTLKSSFSIERKVRETLQQADVMGRNLEKPDVFSLSLEEGECVLTHSSAAAKPRWVLIHANCIAVDDPSN